MSLAISYNSFNKIFQSIGNANENEIPWRTSVNAQCYLKAVFVFVSVGNGEACLTSEQCDQWVKHSLCVEGTCQCREDEAEHTDDVTGTVYCAELPGGGVCEDDDQCLCMYNSVTFTGNLQMQ